MAGTRSHEEKQQNLTVSRQEKTMIRAKWQMQDLNDDKHERKDAETTQTCKLKRRSNSVLSDLEKSHLLSRERNTTRRAVPFTADSESDDLTESASTGHCVHVLQHHKPKTRFV